MIIKKYIGDTQAEAEDMARKELGPAIVIMNVVPIKRKGIARLFKNPRKEVTVGVEEESERLSSAIKDIARVVKESENSVNISVPEPVRKEAEPETARKSRNYAEESIEDMDAKLSSITTMLKSTLEGSSAKEVKEESTDNFEPSPETEGQAFIKLLYTTMIENEVHEKYANSIIEALEKDIDLRKEAPINFLLTSVYQKMILKFGKPSVITPSTNPRSAKVVFFVGPTGVGKTTTIAKIASKFSVDDNKKVVLLTTDTYRIAAAEQLKTYADILNVPFKVVYTPDELCASLIEFKDADYILIDTAGHSHQNAEQKEAMHEFLKIVPQEIEKEVYLVVSATTKYKDLVSIAETYKEMTDYKLIFTKLDETLMLGNLLNLKLSTGAQMSYVTCGQNVPDDIAQFNPQATVKQLLGGSNRK